MVRRSPIPTILGLFLLAAAAAHGAEHVVEVRNNVFDPPTLHVQAGDTVTWRKDDGFHNVVADDGSFRSGAATAAPFELVHTFWRHGSIAYQCEPHRFMGMVGTVVVAPAAPEPCVPSGEVLCLGEGGRFSVRVAWWTTSAAGPGHAVALPAMPDSGLFTFFGPGNAELLVKVLDACTPPFDRYWVFYGATTNVGFELLVTDTHSGEQRAYTNPLGQPAPPVQDTQAFATCP